MEFKIGNMKSNNRNKKKELIQAIASRNMDKLKKALALNKPEKWICIVRDHETKTLKYLGNVIPEHEMKSILVEEEKEFNVHLTVMNFNKKEDGCREENWSFLDSSEMVFDHELSFVFPK